MELIAINGYLLVRKLGSYVIMKDGKDLFKFHDLFQAFACIENEAV